MSDSPHKVLRSERMHNLDILLVDDNVGARNALESQIRDTLKALKVKCEIVSVGTFEAADAQIKAKPNLGLLVTDVNLLVAGKIDDKAGMVLVQTAMNSGIPTIATSSYDIVKAIDVSLFYSDHGATCFRYVDKFEYNGVNNALKAFVENGGRWTHSDECVEQPAVISTPNDWDQLVTKLSRMSHIGLSECMVVGLYRRFDQESRHKLIRWNENIVNALEKADAIHENFLIWAAPGSGKTFFVEQVAAALGNAVQFHAINLAGDTFETLDRKLILAASDLKPALILLDEFDTPNPTIKFAEFFKRLDLNLEPSRRVVFVLVGSSQTGRKEALTRISETHKGADLLRRIPEANRFELPEASLEDLIVMMASQAKAASVPHGRNIKRIQKAAAFYVMATDAYHNPGQLTDLTKKAVQRSTTVDIVYDDLFDKKNLHKYQFVSEHLGAAIELWDQYIELED